MSTGMAWALLMIVGFILMFLILIGKALSSIYTRLGEVADHLYQIKNKLPG